MPHKLRPQSNYPTTKPTQSLTLMDKETLFKAIHNREVVLWAGSGFSKYAGFPMGAGFMRHLFDSLSKGQQQQVREYNHSLDADGYPTMSLPAFATLFTTLQNGQVQPLRREINRVYSARPKSLKTHQQLAKIPFFEHIVTTNYDTLFEQAYGSDKLHVVIEGNQLPYQERQKTTFYKVHGSLERPDSLLISEEDYRRFYSKADRLLWSYIESLMTTHTLLFVGYGLEDPNVLGLFEQILDAVGGNMRGAYLVAPSMSPLRQEWLKKKNVTYIASTGEQLIEDLHQYLLDEAIPALKQGTDLTSTTHFLRNLGLKPTIISGNEGHIVAGLEGLDGEIPVNFKFTVNEIGHDSISRFQEGLSGLAMRLDTSQLMACEWRVSGVNLGVEVAEMLLVRHPIRQKTVDIEFSGGLRIQDATLSIYSSKTRLDILVTSPLHKLEVVVLKKDLKNAKGIRYSASISRRRKYFDSVDSGLLHAQILQSIGRGEEFNIFEDGELIWHGPAQSPFEHFLKQGDALERNMQRLRTIEKGFGCRFRRFLFTPEAADSAYQLHRVMQMKSVENNNYTDNIEVDITEGTDVSKLAEQLDHVLVIDRHVDVTYDLMDWELNIVYDIKHILYRPIFRKYSKDKTSYRITSANKRLDTSFGSEQTLKVVKHGTPERIQEPDGRDLEEILATGK